MTKILTSYEEIDQDSDRFTYWLLSNLLKYSLLASFCVVASDRQMNFLTLNNCDKVDAFPNIKQFHS